MVSNSAKIMMLTGLVLAASSDANAEAPAQQLEQIIQKEDLRKVNDISPTSYYIVDEDRISCKGRYGGRVYSGEEKIGIIDREGRTIHTVCGRYYAALRMEGTGKLIINGKYVMVNYGGIKAKKRRYTTELGVCNYGFGISRVNCLLPFYSVAADTSVRTQNHWKVGDIIYVPSVRGFILPDGSRHQGFFIVRDNGEAFLGKGPQGVDFFAGKYEHRKYWEQKGFNKPKRFEAYKVEAKSRQKAHAWFERRFGRLYRGK
jgi:hypothetical protein